MDSPCLPRGQPESERRACLYTRANARIMKIFEQISDLAYPREQAFYEKIMDIDRRLKEAHDILPPYFQQRPVAQCIADPADLIMRRRTLELLYQKSRIVLRC